MKKKKNSKTIENTYSLIPLTIRLKPKEYQSLDDLSRSDNLSYSRVIAKMINSYHYNKFVIKAERESKIERESKAGAYKLFFYQLIAGVRDESLIDIVGAIYCMDHCIPLDEVESYGLKRYDKAPELVEFLDGYVSKYPFMVNDKDYQFIRQCISHKNLI